MSRNRLTVEQILGKTMLDVTRTSTVELKRQTQTLIDRNRKTVNRLLADPFGAESEAAQMLRKQGLVDETGRFNPSVKGLTNRAEVKAVFDKMRIIAKSNKYTLRGETADRHRVEKKIGHKFTDPEEYKAFWKAYRELEGSTAMFDSERRMKIVERVSENSTEWEEIYERASKLAKKEYEQQERDEQMQRGGLHPVNKRKKGISS